MLKRLAVIAAIAAGGSCASASVTFSLSFDPAAPADRVTVDIFADVTPGDKWTASGIRAIAMNGATFHYATDNDANTTSVDMLIAPYRNDPVTDQYVTSLSRPRVGRANDNRFNNNALAALVSRFSPQGPSGSSIATATEVNTAWFASPPNTFGSPSVDGYIARLALDFTVPSGNTLGVGQVNFIPANATVILLSEPDPADTHASFGFVGASFQQPALVGFDWAIWYVPEPSSGLVLILLGLAAGVARGRH